jgi:hypothetical protein
LDETTDWNAETRVHIGAIVSLAGERQRDEASFGRKYSRNGAGFLAGSSRGRLEILGRSLLDRTISKLRQFPSLAVKIIPESPVSTGLLPARSAKASNFITAWETAVAQHLHEGAQQLLLLRIGPYYDLEYEELMRFHVQRGRALTQAYGAAGALDLAVVEAECLRSTETPYRKVLSAFISEQERFFYDGYVNPLNRPQDFLSLVEDGLEGRCGLRPAGREVATGIWIAPGAQVDPSVTFAAPAFIGVRSHVAEGCSITGASSIEGDCEIDCGTTVHNSWILQGVYVGVALNLQRSMVSQKKLFHLDRNVEIEVDDERLIGPTKLAPLSRAAALGGRDAE